MDLEAVFDANRAELRGVRGRNVKAIVQAIADAEHGDSCDLTGEELAERAGMHRATFFRWLPVAEELGYVEKEVRWDGKFQTASRYRLGLKFSESQTTTLNQDLRVAQCDTMAEYTMRINRSKTKNNKRDISFKDNYKDNRESQFATLRGWDSVTSAHHERHLAQIPQNGNHPASVDETPELPDYVRNSPCVIEAA